MKVLHIINSLQTGGAEKLLLDTIPYYVKRGIETDLLLLNGKETPFKKKLANKNSTNVFNLGMGSVYNPIHIFKVIPYLKKYDLIHVHLFPAQYWVVFAKLLAFSKVKLVFTEHNTTNRRLENKLYKFIDKFMYRFYDKVICISNEIYEIIKKHSKLKPEKLAVIENGVDLVNFREAQKLDASKLINDYDSNDKIIIQIAGFRAQKDQQTLIKAMQYVPSNVKLVLVGDGVLKESCEQLVKQIKLNHKVVFLGMRNDIPQLLKTADIVVLSSKYEGLSLSSIEGMAVGKPFIASNVPGLKKVVEGAGMLFELGNAKELASHITKLLSNKSYYKKVAADCLERAENYDISVMIDKHIALYKRTINEK